MNLWHRLQYRLLRSAADAIARGGLPRIRFFGELVGSLLWYCLPSRRALACSAIQKHLNVSPERARQIARQSFAHNGRSFMEILLAPQVVQGWSQMRFAQPGLEKAVKEAKRPIVCSAAHLGAWELLAGPLGWMPEHPGAAIVRSHNNPAIWRFLVEQRSACGAAIVGHRNAVLAALRILRQQGAIAALSDHNTRREEATFLPFLGETASVTIGPALLAVRSNALVWPMFMIREGDTYVLHAVDPLDCALLEGSPEEKIQQVAAFYTQAIEQAVRKHPEQWFWMHKRWKTQPEKEFSHTEAEK